MTKPFVTGLAGKSSSRYRAPEDTKILCEIRRIFERAGDGSCQRCQVKAIRVVARFCICCFSLACAARIFFALKAVNQPLRTRRCDILKPAIDMNSVVPLLTDPPCACCDAMRSASVASA